MKRFFTLALVGVMLLCAMQIVQRQMALADKLVRLHVIANSDSPSDQRLKLAVRDAVLEQVDSATAHCANKEQTLRVLERELPALQRTAQNTLRQLGCDDAVQVSLTQERFPTRYYETFTLPAGQYTSLRVELGQAQGRNWWCVAFPTLCTAAQLEDMRAIAVGYGFSQEEVAMITQAEEYQIDFKILELLEKLRNLIGI